MTIARIYMPVSSEWIAITFLGLFILGVPSLGLKSIANWLLLVVAGMWAYESSQESVAGGDRSIWFAVLVVGSCLLTFPWAVAITHREMDGG